MEYPEWQPALIFDPLPESFTSMLKKALFALFFLGISLGLAFYVYPTHPVLVWVLLGLCWACFRLGLRAQKLFRAHGAKSEPTLAVHSPALLKSLKLNR